MNNELMDIYDKNKNKTGRVIERVNSDNLKENEYVISVHCFIINNNKILLTQRSLNKNRGGKWEDTHGGLKAGEDSITGIIRELKEEIGIKVSADELKYYKTIKRKNKYRDIFILKKEIPISDFKFNDGEVMACKYVTFEELKKMIKNDECTFKKIEDIPFYDVDIGEL